MRRKDKWTKATVLLVGAATAVACSTIDDDMEPTVRGDVRTQLMLSLADISRGSRMSDQTVQEAGESAFRGITDVCLIPFATAGESPALPVGGNVSRNGQENVALRSSGAAPAEQADNSITTLYDNSNAKVYTEIDIPDNTRAFLFYGQAPDNMRNADDTETESRFVNGAIAANGLADGTPAGITFSPVQIYTETGVPTQAAALAHYLTAVCQALNDCTHAKLKEMGQTLQTNHAGASANVRAMMESLYASVDNTEATTGEKESVKEAIRKGYNADTEELLTDYNYNGEAVNLQGYPAIINIPDGAACVRWDTTEEVFEALSTNSVMGMTNPALTSFTYPAPLYYRANSRIRTSARGHADEIPNRDSWDGNTNMPVLNLYETENGTVTGATASVALTDPIQYAVARLDMTIKAAEANLKDSKGNTVTVGSSSFPVTGIIVGSQQRVDYQLEPTFEEATEYIAYDRHVRNVMLTTAESNTNHTLLLQTKPGEDVNVAVEVENRCRDFYGYDPNEDASQLIPYGCRFYLVGTLNWTDDAKTNPNGLEQVLTQDYVTTVNFTVNSLENAHYTVPDLRSPSLRLSLYVDLNWQRGAIGSVE